MLKELLLGNPFGYKSFQRAAGAEKMRRILTRDYIHPKPGDRILDIGCGTADIRPYLGNTVSYLGIDSNESYIKHDRLKYCKDSSTLFICKDMNDDITHPYLYDIVLLIGVLHHISDQSVYKLLPSLPQLLRPSGRIITMDGCYTDDLTSFETMLLRNDRGKFVRSLSEWKALFSRCIPEATYEIRKDLYYLPFNCILFQYQRS